MIDADEFNKFAQGETATKPPEPAKEPDVKAAEDEAEVIPPAAKEPEPEAVKFDPARHMDRHRHAAVLSRVRTEAAQNAAKVSELEAQLAKTQAAPTARNIEALETIKAKLLEKEFAPELMEMLDVVGAETLTTKQELAEMRKVLTAYEQRERSATERAMEAEAAQVEEAIHADPVLRAWATEAFPEQGEPPAGAKERWEKLVEHDERLARAPAWEGKPQAERFAEATRRTAADYGINITLPEKQEKKELPGIKTSIPTSLSNIPAGKTPVATGPQNIELLDVQSLIKATRGMTEAQKQKMFFGA